MIYCNGSGGGGGGGEKVQAVRKMVNKRQSEKEKYPKPLEDAEDEHTGRTGLAQWHQQSGDEKGKPADDEDAWWGEGRAERGQNQVKHTVYPITKASPHSVGPLFFLLANVVRLLTHTHTHTR